MNVTADLFGQEAARCGPTEQKMRQLGCDFELKFLPYDVIEDMNFSYFQTRQNDEGVDPKLLVDPDRVQCLIDDIQNGDTLRAVVVFLHKGEYIVCEGRHRLYAHNKTRIQNGFYAYIIEIDDDRLLIETGERLSCLLNDINGERTGRDRNDRNNRRDTIERCVSTLLKMFLIKIPSNDEIKQHASSFRLKNFQQIKEKYYVRRCEMAALEASTTICAKQHDAEKIFKLISRAESSQKKNLIDTISAFCKTKEGNEKTREILDDTACLPITSVIEKMQEVALLNPDNTDKTLGAKTAIEHIKNLERPAMNIKAQLRARHPLYGDEKLRAMGIIQDLVKSCAEQLRIWSEV